MSKPTFALVGNPNCGKTCLFNALTGARQRVGNWPGVTVARKEGRLTLAQDTINLIDLPGIYSFTDDHIASPDTKVTHDYLLNTPPAKLIYVLDATQLERQLYLFSQLSALKIPMVVVLTMNDMAAKQGITINTTQLSEKMGAKVIALQGYKRKHLQPLLQVLLEKHPTLPVVINVRHLKTPLERADALFRWAYETSERVITQKATKQFCMPEKIDDLLLHKIWGIPLFFLMLYGLFFFSLHIGGLFQDFFDIGARGLFVEAPIALLNYLHVKWTFLLAVVEGVGTGINTVVTFIPVMTAFFFALGFLENSGYLPRAAFVMDKAMQKLGLPGHAFVPLIVGFGCNVPSVMGARTLRHAHERTLTVLMSPFMSCSARLSVYVLFVSAFFTHGGDFVILSLYCVGVLVAVLTALFVRQFFPMHYQSPFIMELPPYRLPNMQALTRYTLHKLTNFIKRAGKLIIGFTAVLTILANISVDKNGQSILERSATSVTPLFAPMGLHENNWPATVGIFAGASAKEVVIGTLNSLYTAQKSQTPTFYTVQQSLGEALGSVGKHFYALGYALTHPLAAGIKMPDTHASLSARLVKAFGNAHAAYAYLLFILLYLPCISTLAAIKEELNSKMAGFALIWSSAIAYTTATFYYQWATVTAHVSQTLVLTCFLLFSLILLPVFTNYCRKHKKWLLSA